MTQKELSLFDYAISVINGLKNQGKPMPLATETVCQYLEINRKKLNKESSCWLNFKGIDYEICFSHSDGNIDYWLVYEKYAL